MTIASDCPCRAVSGGARLETDLYHEYLLPYGRTEQNRIYYFTFNETRPMDGLQKTI
jgi:hypothetical protein